MQVALIQAKVSMNQSENWDRAEEMLKDATVQGARRSILVWSPLDRSPI